MAASVAELLTDHPLAAGWPPQWASSWGEDARGPWLAFAMEDIEQRLRWVPPGRFLMGSPDGEAGRFDDEGPRHVETIGQGFWLFETPCTQALWQAVTGENPSQFTDPERPVEQVSWEDCGTFTARVAERVEGLRLSLPTEAEWEYACRAGTRTATYAGDLEIQGDCNAPVLDPIAWYGGNCNVEFDLEDGDDMSEWPEKQHEFAKGGSRKVGRKEPNAWGLHDMLGNVWEWCRDEWRPDYRQETEADTAKRVIRGGSWCDVARFVRAAGRDWIPPSVRILYLGFRCRVQ